MDILQWQFIVLFITAILFITYFLFNPVKSNTNNDANLGANNSVNINPLRWSIIVGSILLLLFSAYALLNKEDNNLEDNNVLTLESIKELENYLINNPDDVNSLKILALAYLNLADIANSIATFKKALELAPEDVDLLLQYASILSYKNNNSFAGEAQIYVEKALNINPNSFDALYLSGFVAIDNEDYSKAKDYWQKALSLEDNTSEQIQIIESVIYELENL